MCDRKMNLCRMGRALVVLVMALVPVGSAVAQDYDAVERKLGEAIAEGHLSLEQAQQMMHALRKSQEHQGEHSIEERIGSWIGETSERITRAVVNGEITEEQGWEKWLAFKEKELMPKLTQAIKEGLVSEQWVGQVKRGLHEAELGEQLKAAVERGDLTEDEAWAKWEAAQAKWEAMQKQGWGSKAAEPWLSETVERFEKEIAARSPEENKREMQALVEGLEQAKQQGNEERVKILSIEIKMIKQALAKPGEKKRGGELMAAYEKAGVEIGPVKEALGDAGIKGEQMRDALGVVLRLAYQAKEQGEGFKLGDQAMAYLKNELKLTGDQIERIQSLAWRIGRSMSDGGAGR